MPDSAGYLTETELKPIDEFEGTPLEFIDYVQSVWRYDAYSVDVTEELGTRVRRWNISTAGWSGNEEIISRMQTTMFWFLWWHMSRRGGHYEFRIPEQFWDNVMHLGDPRTPRGLNGEVTTGA